MAESSGTTPKTILLIRHAEKPGDPERDDDLGEDRDGNHGAKFLSCRGAARAAALPTLFPPKSSPLACGIAWPASKDEPGFLGHYASYDPSAASSGSPRSDGLLPRPDALFATANSKHSHRPKQTVIPTGAALDLDVDTEFDNSEPGINDLAALMWTPPYDGLTVLICWHHGTMDTLATQLRAVPPGRWHGSVFDRVWRIDYTAGKGTLTVVEQRLLYGDQP